MPVALRGSLRSHLRVTAIESLHLTHAAQRVLRLTLGARLVAAAFGQRRKTLRNALSPLADERLLRAAGIDPSARGETLSVDDFARLANDATTLQSVSVK